MIQLLALAICIVAFGALALATERHQQAVFARMLPARATRLLRIAGWGGIVVALWVMIGHLGWGLGLVYFSGQTSLAAGLIYVTLIVCGRPR